MKFAALKRKTSSSTRRFALPTIFSPKTPVTGAYSPRFRTISPDFSFSGRTSPVNTRQWMARTNGAIDITGSYQTVPVPPPPVGGPAERSDPRRPAMLVLACVHPQRHQPTPVSPSTRGDRGVGAGHRVSRPILPHSQLNTGLPCAAPTGTSHVFRTCAGRTRSACDHERRGSSRPPVALDLLVQRTQDLVEPIQVVRIRRESPAATSPLVRAEQCALDRQCRA